MSKNSFNFDLPSKNSQKRVGGKSFFVALLAVMSLILGLVVGVTYSTVKPATHSTESATFFIGEHSGEVAFDNAEIRCEDSSETTTQFTIVPKPGYDYVKDIAIKSLTYSGDVIETIASISVAENEKTAGTSDYAYAYDENKGLWALSISNEAIQTYASSHREFSALKIVGTAVGKTYTVSFDLEDGSAIDPTANKLATYGSEVPALTVLPTRVGYTFGGFYTAQNGFGTMVYNKTGASMGPWEIIPANNANSITLHAYWIANAYRVILDNQSATTAGVPSVDAIYNSAMPSIADDLPTRIGYTFDGYYSEKNGGGTKYILADGTSNHIYDLTTNTTLYAKWIGVGYQVVFNGNGSTSGEMSNQDFTYDVSQALNANEYGRAYIVTFNYDGATGGNDTANATATYTFDGWATVANGDVVYENGQTVLNLTNTANDTVNLYAHWQSGSVTLPTPTRTGYTFGGWCSDSGLTTLVTGATYTPTENKTLYAKWIANTYTVVFDGNKPANATGAVAIGQSNITATYDQAIKSEALISATLTGWTFNGWFTEAVGGSAVTNASTNLVADPASNGLSSVTVYAHWTANTYYVSFNGNGSTSGEMNNQQFTYDVSQALTANAYGRAYTVTYNYDDATGGNGTPSATATYTFDGWATSASGAVVYSNQESVSNLSSTASAVYPLYAHWTSASVVLPTPTKTGYTFGGWYSDSGLQTSVGVGGTNYTPTVTITLFAKWNTISYNIDYTLNGGSVATENPTSYTIESAAITLNNPTKTGYTFTGWSGTDLTGNENTSVTIASGSTGDRAYTANWTVISYNITYNLNGGSVATENPTNYTIESAAITLNNPTKTGYTFAGWSGTGLTGNENTSVIIASGSTGDRAYTANWTAISYNITYNLNGGSATNPTNYTIESAAITLNNPTKTGYTFAGWSGTDLTGDANTEVTIASGSTGDRAYTANWTANTYDVSFNGNGSTSGVMSNQQFTYDVSQALTANAYGRAYTVTYYYNGATSGDDTASATATYTFDGWATSASGEKVYNNQESVSNLASTASAVYPLYAHWTSGSVSLPTPTKTGYTFGGWYSDSTLQTPVGVGGASYTPTANIDLYAMWGVSVTITNTDGYASKITIDGVDYDMGDVAILAVGTTHIVSTTMRNDDYLAYSFASYVATSGTVGFSPNATTNANTWTISESATINIVGASAISPTVKYLVYDSSDNEVFYASTLQDCATFVNGGVAYNIGTGTSSSTASYTIELRQNVGESIASDGHSIAFANTSQDGIMLKSASSTNPYTITVNFGTWCFDEPSNNDFEGNKVGFIHVQTGTLTLSDITLTRVSVDWWDPKGRGVFVDAGATFIMDDGATINGFHSDYYNGGGVYVYGYYDDDNSAWNRGTFTMTGGTISNNEAGSEGYCGGGGVYVNGGAFTMDGGTISGNSATHYGGGVCVCYDGTFTMTGGTISGGNSQSGGGVCIGVMDDYDFYNNTFTMSGGTITGNTAVEGGGVHVYNGTFTMTGGTITGNAAIDSDSQANGGGGVYGSFTMDGGAVYGNNFNGDMFVWRPNLCGGVSDSSESWGFNDDDVSNYYGFMVRDGKAIKIALSDNAITNDELTFTFGNNSANLPTVTGVLTYTWSNSADVNDNITAVSGLTDYDSNNVLEAYLYALVPTFTVTLNANDGTVNPASLTNVKALSTYGELPTPTKNGYAFIGWNKASDGSGEWVSADAIVRSASAHTLYAIWLSDSDSLIANYNYIVYSSVFAQGCTTLQEAIDLCDAGKTSFIIETHDDGYYITNPISSSLVIDGKNIILKSIGTAKTLSVEFDSSCVENESYSSANGFLKLIDNATLTLENIVIRGVNTSNTNGRGIYVYKSTLVMNTGATISGFDTGYGYGGAVYVDNGTFTMNDGTISENTAYNGGGVYVYSGENHSIFTMNDGTISENTADYGGGVYVCGYDGTFTMNSGIISGNTAEYSGGGVYVSDGDFVMTGGIIQSNISSDEYSAEGGGVYVSYGDVVMTGGAVYGNIINNGKFAQYSNISGTVYDANESTLLSDGSEGYYGFMMRNGKFMLIKLTDNLIANDSSIVFNFSGLETNLPTVSGGLTYSWRASADGSAVTAVSAITDDEYSSGTVYTAYLYASFPSVNVTLNAGTNGSVSPASLTNLVALHPYGELPTPTNSQANQLFLGWNTLSNGEGDWITPESVVSTSITTLYAIWYTMQGTGNYIVYNATSKQEVVGNYNTLASAVNACSSSSSEYHIYLVANDGASETISTSTTISSRNIVLKSAGTAKTISVKFTAANGNTATSGTNANKVGFIKLTSSASLTLENINIKMDATTTYKGRGIFIYNATLTMGVGSSISDFNGVGYGGGVYIYSGEFIMNGGVIKNNSATSSGGGVYRYGGTFTMNSGAIYGNQYGSNYTSQYANVYGAVKDADGNNLISSGTNGKYGFVYVSDTLNYIMTTNSSKLQYVLVNTTVLDGNDLPTLGIDGNAGGTFVWQDEYGDELDDLPDWEDMYITFQEVKYAVYDANNALIDTCDTLAECATIVNARSTACTIMVMASEVEEDFAYYGIPITNSYGVTLKSASSSSPSTISVMDSDNESHVDNGGTVGSRRVGFLDVANGGSLTLQDIILVGGFDDSGSIRCVFVDANSSLTIDSGTTIRKFYTEYNSGAGVYVKGMLTMNNGLITENIMEEYNDGGGAGVYVAANGTFTMHGGSISSNSHNGGGYGGGVNVAANGTFTMTGGTISNNQSGWGNRGGGVYVSSDGIFKMSGGSVHDNEAYDDVAEDFIKTGQYSNLYGSVYDSTGNTVIVSDSQLEDKYGFGFVNNTLTLYNSSQNS